MFRSIIDQRQLQVLHNEFEFQLNLIQIKFHVTLATDDDR